MPPSTKPIEYDSTSENFKFTVYQTYNEIYCPYSSYDDQVDYCILEGSDVKEDTAISLDKNARTLRALRKLDGAAYLQTTEFSINELDPTSIYVNVTAPFSFPTQTAYVEIQGHFLQLPDKSDPSKDLYVACVT